MKTPRSLILGLALGCAIALAAPRAANAAPDDTLGMALMAALVGPDGTLAQNSGATRVLHVAPGGYQVEFDRDVSNCIYTVSPSGFGFFMIAFPAVDPDTSLPAPRRVAVAARTEDQTFIDAAFSLLVFCPR